MLEHVRRAARRRPHPRTRATAADIAPERTAAVQARLPRGARSASTRHVIPWVMCWYPTPALAQEAGMTLAGVRGLPVRRRACSTGRRSTRALERYAALFDAGRARCGSSATAPTSRLSLAGRPHRGRRRHRATCPAASSSAARSRPRPRGRSPSPSSRPSGAATRCAASGCGSRRAGSSTPRPTARRSSCSQTLDTDEGARRIGELGIGCNPGITRYMRNVLLRREDRRHGAPRARLRVPRHRRHERVGRSTGTSSRTCAAAGGSSSTAGSSRRTAIWVVCRCRRPFAAG